MSGHAASPVEAVALFKDRAVVRTIEGQTMLKVGETSEHGVTLLAATPHAAKVRYRDEDYELVLSARVTSRFRQVQEQTVRINQDVHGQYRVRGAINGHYVSFLVDTGASIVAMSERQARSMGLSYDTDAKQSIPGTVQTAQGIVAAYFVQLDAVTIGGITRHGVQASIIQGDYPVDVLLGMSFLSKIRYQDNNGVMVLSATY
jgi:aspartyl protease family protein